MVSELENAWSLARKIELAQNGQSAEDLVQVLSKQLTLERWARQTIIKMHATLDRDAVLQQVVDALGKGLKASRCLIARTDVSPSKVVTHEYVEPDISPLGLGRTEQLPKGLIDRFRYDVGAFFDLADLKEWPEMSAADLKSLSDSAVSAVAGAPISRQGTSFGVIVLLQCGVVKQWGDEELETLALIAEQTAVALSHCEYFQQLKDQLFNMNLIGNLTQQLNSTLELVTKNLRPDSHDEKAKRALVTVPLSFRELEVLKLIASGYANREIAKRLFLTESTVELHASRIRKKLKLKSRTALVKYACDNALV
jgi:DNA-binding CsgD family transcriptional regulator